MPVYPFDCPGCGPFEGYARMKDSDKPQTCPMCGQKRCKRTINLQYHTSISEDWSKENGGRGRLITQIGKPGTPGAYARAPSDVPDLARKAGFRKCEKF